MEVFLVERVLDVEEALHLVGFILVGEDLHLFDVVGWVSLFHELLFSEGVPEAAGVYVFQLSSPEPQKG